MELGFDAKRIFHNATGLGNYSRDVLRILRLHRPGHGYHAYTPRAGKVPQDLEGGGLTVSGPRSSLGRAFPALWRSRGIVGNLVDDRLDLYHGLSAELPEGLEHTGIASVVTVHDLIFERAPELYPVIDRALYRAKARSAARRAHRVVAISEETARDVERFHGVPRERIRVVPPTCHPSFRAPIPAVALEGVARRYAAPARFVLAVGTIERRKNLAVAVDALRGLEKDVHLLVLGRPTPYLGELEAQVRRRGLEARVRFLHGVPTPDLVALQRLATVAVYPSLVEGFGLPILEALASGTPCVTSRGGCFEEAGGDAAAYVDPRDPIELRDVLAAILADPERRRAMIERGLAHAARFDDAVVARALFEVYEEARAA